MFYTDTNIPCFDPANPSQCNHILTLNSFEDCVKEPLVRTFDIPWHDFLNLPEPPSGGYEYAEGKVIWSSHMTGDSAHNNELEYIATMAECTVEEDYRAFRQGTIQVLNPCTEVLVETDKFENIVHRKFLRYGTPVYDPSKIFQLRSPDVVIKFWKRTSGGSSQTNRDPQVEKRIQFTFPISTTVFLLVEILSNSTRTYDLIDKWRAYASTKIPVYVLHDRLKKRIIVGLLSPTEGYVKSCSGDTDQQPILRNTRSRSADPFYYRRVFTGDEIVNCPVYRNWNLTANQLLDEQFLKRYSNRMARERREQREIAEKERERADTEATRANTEATRAERLAKKVQRLEDALRSSGCVIPDSPQSEEGEASVAS